MDGNKKGILLIGLGIIGLVVIISIFSFSFFSTKDLADSGADGVSAGLASYANSTYSEYNGKEYYGGQIRQFLDSALGKRSVILVHTFNMELDKAITDTNDRYVQIYNQVPYINYSLILSNYDSTDVADAYLVKAGDKVELLPDTLVDDGIKVMSNGKVCIQDNEEVADRTIGDFRIERTTEFVGEFDLFESKVITDKFGNDIGVMFTQIVKE